MSEFIQTLRHWRTWLYVALLACIGLAVFRAEPEADPPRLEAGDRVISRAFWVDPSGQMSLAAVQQVALRPAPDLVVLGYTEAALWLRLRVQPLPGQPAEPLLLRVRPSFLDHVQLWEADASAPGGWRSRSSGDQVSFLVGARSYNAFGFDITPAVGGQDYWLRVQSISSLMVYAEALSLAEAHRKDGRLALLHLSTIAVVFCVLCWALYTWWVGRLPLVGWFVLFELTNILYVMQIVGLGSLLEPAVQPALASRFTGLAVMVANPLIIWLHRELLRAYGARGWGMRLLTLLCALQLLALAAFALGWERESLRFSVSLLLPAAFLVLLAALQLRVAPPLMPPLEFMQWVNGLLFVGYMFSLLPLLGLVQAVEWSLHANLLHGPMTAAFMFTMLWRHARLREADQRRLAEGVQRLQLQAEADQRTIELNRQFIDMLTHEVKTPLGVALMSLGALKSDSPYIARIQRALRDINAVVDRTRLSDLIEHNSLRLQVGPCAVRELLYECAEGCAEPERLRVFAGEVDELQTDPGLLAIVINNLLDNALKYSPSNSLVDVHLHREAGTVCLRVSNAVGAAGQPDEARLFSKYYRAPAAHAKSGSGLGLYLSFHLAILLGAKLEYRPHPGRVEMLLCLQA